MTVEESLVQPVLPVDDLLVRSLHQFVQLLQDGDDRGHQLTLTHVWLLLNFVVILLSSEDSFNLEIVRTSDICWQITSIQSHLIIDLFLVLVVLPGRQVLQAGVKAVQLRPVLGAGGALAGEVVLGEVLLSGGQLTAGERFAVEVRDLLTLACIQYLYKGEYIDSLYHLLACRQTRT